MYTELQVTTNFSFLRGSSYPDELLEQAQLYGCDRLGITDRNSLAGAVRMHSVAKKNNMRALIGCRLDLQDGPSLLAYPTDLAAYQRLCQLLTLGNRRTVKGECHLMRQDVFDYARGIKFILVAPDRVDATFRQAASEYKSKLGCQLYLGATCLYDGQDSKRLVRLAQLSNQLFVPMVATNDVQYHAPERRELHDVLTCVREGCTIYNAGYRLNPNAERYLKSTEEMTRLFRNYPEAIRRTQEIADACRFSLDELKYEYPDEIITPGRTPQEELEIVTWQGVRDRCGANTPSKIKNIIKHELGFVRQMDYASYFLTVYDIVCFARSKGILCQGRGSAANSAICYYLGITSVDPSKFDLLFERFISPDRNEPPDIDVDFEHERREEVIQYIYAKYGRDRAAIVATVNEYRQKGAIRDVGKAMGLSEDTIMRLSGTIWQFSKEWFEDPAVMAQLKLQGIDLIDPTLRKVLSLARQLLGFPRHLGQHTGGFVITKSQLSDFCPILNASMAERTNIEWNKDDIDDIGLLKVDVLGLGMLTTIRRAFDLAKHHYGQVWTLADIPPDDPETYAMLSRADSIGVFQVESRAQMSMLPRLKPKCFYDLVVEVAIVRPGPIQGDMVHPYLRRREGKEAVTYPSKELEAILGKTLGVPLFQEQAMKIAIVAAGFTPSEADQLRRAMATFKLTGLVSVFEDKLIKGMMSKGYTEDFARRVFRQLEGFGSYGFPESHAASFALLVYISAWLKCHYPDVFAAAILNSQPMGFYAPAQLVRDARNHDVEIREVDINHSDWDYTLEHSQGRYHALRIGFRQIKGLSEPELQVLVQSRGGGYASIRDLWRRSGLSLRTLENLAHADAFGSLKLTSRQALWEIKALGEKPASLFENQKSEAISEPPVSLPPLTEGELLINDYTSKSLSLKGHAISFIRDQLNAKRVVPAHKLLGISNFHILKVAGHVLMRQRPGTAGGIVFITLEDEYSTVNVVVFRKVFEEYRHEIISGEFLMVEGKMDQKDGVIHVIARKIWNISPWLRNLPSMNGRHIQPVMARADEFTSGQPDRRGKPKVFPDARNFR